jgi:hypothetical protein
LKNRKEKEEVEDFSQQLVGGWGHLKLVARHPHKTGAGIRLFSSALKKKSAPMGEGIQSFVRD